MNGDDADKAFQALYEIFSQPRDPCKGCGRKYVLEFVAGRLVFRRDEIDLIFETVFEEAFPSGEESGNEIVPEKLARFFPDPHPPGSKARSKISLRPQSDRPAPPGGGGT